MLLSQLLLELSRVQSSHVNKYNNTISRIPRVITGILRSWVETDHWAVGSSESELSLQNKTSDNWLDTMSKKFKNPEKNFNPYGVNIAKKPQSLEQYMAANEEDNKNFNEWRLATLDTYIMSLQDQVSHMEASWDAMLDDGSLIPAAFNKIGTLMDDT